MGDQALEMHLGCNGCCQVKTSLSHSPLRGSTANLLEYKWSRARVFRIPANRGDLLSMAGLRRWCRWARLWRARTLSACTQAQARTRLRKTQARTKSASLKPSMSGRISNAIADGKQRLSIHRAGSRNVCTRVNQKRPWRVDIDTFINIFYVHGIHV